VPGSEEDVIQRRLASNSILNRAGGVFEGAAADEEDGAVPVIGIRVQRISESANRRVSESANQRGGGSASRRVNESASQRINESARRRGGE